MKICLLCKTPIQENTGVAVVGGFVHSGICQHKLNEVQSKMNESKDSVEVKDIQLLM